MKKVLLAALLVLTAGLIAVGPAEARSSRLITLKVPTIGHAGQAVLVEGRAPARYKKVRIERKAGKRWVLVRRAAIRPGDRYAIRIRPALGVSVFRARVSSGASATRTIRVIHKTVTPKPPSVPTDGCGVRPRKPDGSWWRCTFQDDFTGPVLDRAKWTPQTLFASGTRAQHACYLDAPAFVSQSDGALNLTVRKVAAPISCDFGGMSGPTRYVAGSVMTYRIFSQQYGRFEARIKTTATDVPGLHEAFWLWPDDRYSDGSVWPDSGEIDITETYSRYPDLSIPFLHYSADTRGNVLGLNTAWDCRAARGEWNTYTLDWSAERLEILINGISCLVNTSGDAAFRKPYILALSQMLGASGNELAAGTPIPATMNVDYVKVWQ